MSAVAIIPARGNSRGIPRKCLAKVAGKPLIQYTLDAALAASSLGRVIVSTDNPEIALYCRQPRVEVLARPAELASDETPMFPVLAHAIEALGLAKEYEELVLLQPTSPLRPAGDIEAALAKFRSEKADALISVAEADNKMLKNFTLDRETGRLRGLLGPGTSFLRRQDLPQVYTPNGAIYVYRTSQLVDPFAMFPPNTVAFVMPAERSIDVDNPEDLDRVAKCLAASKSSS